MFAKKTDRSIFKYPGLLLSVLACVSALVFMLCGETFCVFQRADAIPRVTTGVNRHGSPQIKLAFPGVSCGEDGFNVDKMWQILFKSPTAYKAETKAREQRGGQSPFAGKTRLKFACFYPTSRKILIPAEFSDTRAALAYAYELKHFEQADVTLDLQAQLRDGAVSVSRFTDRCIELESHAAYQEVKVARELRKAWVLGAHSEWEAYCRPGEDEQESVSHLLSAIDSQGIVPGTGRTARGYYIWLATQKLQEAAPEKLAAKGNVAAGP